METLFPKRSSSFLDLPELRARGADMRVVHLNISWTFPLSLPFWFPLVCPIVAAGGYTTLLKPKPQTASSPFVSSLWWVFSLIISSFSRRPVSVHICSLFSVCVCLCQYISVLCLCLSVSVYLFSLFSVCVCLCQYISVLVFIMLDCWSTSFANNPPEESVQSNEPLTANPQKPLHAGGKP